MSAKNWGAIRRINQNRAARKRGAPDPPADDNARAKTTRGEGTSHHPSAEDFSRAAVELEDLFGPSPATTMDSEDDEGPRGAAGEADRISSEGGVDGRTGASVGGGTSSNPLGGIAASLQQNKMLGSGVRKFRINNIRTAQIPIMGQGQFVLPLWMLEWWTLLETYRLNEAARQLYNAPFQIMNMKFRIFNITNISNELRSLGGGAVTTQTLTSAPMCMSIINSWVVGGQMRLNPQTRRVPNNPYDTNSPNGCIRDGIYTNKIGDTPFTDGFSEYVNLINNADQNFWFKPGNEIQGRFSYQQKGPYNWLYARNPNLYRGVTSANALRWNVLANTQSPIDVNLPIQNRYTHDNPQEQINNYLDPDNVSSTRYSGPSQNANRFGIPEPASNLPIVVIHMVPLQRSTGNETAVMEILGNIHIETELEFIQAPPQFQSSTNAIINNDPDSTANTVFVSGGTYSRGGQLYSKTLPQLNTTLSDGQAADNMLASLRDIYPFSVPSMISKNGIYHNHSSFVVT